ncbi:MAG: UxaA family hydrolase [Desulfobacterales bacterium]
MKNNALHINGCDNVVIATRDIAKNDLVVAGGKQLFYAAEAVGAGHKIALIEIDAGDHVIRYGEPIVKALEKIYPGQWIHTHNTRPIS